MNVDEEPLPSKVQSHPAQKQAAASKPQAGSSDKEANEDVTSEKVNTALDRCHVLFSYSVDL
jgi:hypothetical protein